MTTDAAQEIINFLYQFSMSMAAGYALLNHVDVSEVRFSFGITRVSRTLQPTIDVWVDKKLASTMTHIGAMKYIVAGGGQTNSHILRKEAEDAGS